MLLPFIILNSLFYCANSHAIVRAPPPGYYCYLQCLNKCLATPPVIKTNDLLDHCKTQVCWPMTPDESYCDPNRRACFRFGSCKPSDVGWISDASSKVQTPKVTSRRSFESASIWRVQWDAVPGAQFYALYRWKEGDNSTMFYHDEVRNTSTLFPIAKCKQHHVRVAAISTTGMSPFSDVTKAYAYLNESEEVMMKLNLKSASLVSMPYFYDPVPVIPSNRLAEPIEPNTLVLTIGYHITSAGWIDHDVQDLINYAFLPMSCMPSDSNLDLTLLKPVTVSGRQEFVLNLPGSIAQRKCKFLFSVKTISTPCGRTARVIHDLPGAGDGAYGLWSTIDCAKIQNAICQDDTQRLNVPEKPTIPRHSAIDEPPRGEDPQETEDTLVTVQTPRNNDIRFFDENGVQPLAVLLAFLVALPVILFWILRCTVCKSQKKVMTPM